MLHVLPAFTQWYKIRITQWSCRHEGRYRSCKWYLWPIHLLCISLRYPIGWFVVYNFLNPYKLLQAMVRGIIAQKHLCPLVSSWTPRLIREVVCFGIIPRQTSFTHNQSHHSHDKEPPHPYIITHYPASIQHKYLEYWYQSSNTGSSHCCPRCVNHQLFRTKSNSNIVAIPVIPPSTSYRNNICPPTI